MNRTSITAITIAVAFAIAIPALAQDMPKRKSGLWEITMDSDNARKAGGKERQMTQCVDQTKDDVFRQMGQQAERENKCSRTNVQRSANKLSFESTCDFGSMKTASTSVITGDFNTAYRMEIHSRYTPPMAGVSEGTTVIDAKWTGPCKAGQRPGDITVAGGRTMNIYDMMDAKKK